MADNINISPEMINNLVNMLKNTETNNDIKTNLNQPSNLNKIPTDTTISSIDFNNIADILSKFKTNTDNNQTIDDSNSNSIDFDTILKLKSIMETINTKNDPRSNLLYSLKPYLRESKRSKLDQYANLLKITQVTGLFKNEKEN